MPRNTRPSRDDVICQERIRQARWGFNFALGFFATGWFVILVGVGLLFAEKTPQGSLAAAGGATSNLISYHLYRFAKDANDRLDRMLTEGDGEQRNNVP